MPLVKAKCTQCGADLEVDSTSEAAICKYCGTPFIVEKAINNYNIQNHYTIQNANIQSGATEETLLKLARRSKQNNNSAEATKYYSQILLLDPDNWEAAFYSVYYSLFDSQIAEIEYAANTVTNCYDSTFELIGKLSPEEQKPCYSEITDKVIEFSTMIGMVTMKFRKEHLSYKNIEKETKSRLSAIINMCSRLADIIKQRYNDNEIILRIYNHLSDVYGLLPAFGGEKYLNNMKIKEIEAEIEHENFENNLNEKYENIPTYDAEKIKELERQRRILEEKKNIALSGSGLSPFISGMIAIICVGIIGLFLVNYGHWDSETGGAIVILLSFTIAIISIINGIRSIFVTKENRKTGEKLIKEISLIDNEISVIKKQYNLEK